MKSAIVIGSGFGGLSIANRLQSQGFQTTLLEAREKIGGRAYQLQASGYTFDMGPSIITSVDLIQEIFQQAGYRMEDSLELVPCAPYYRVYFHDRSFIDYSGDTESMKEQIRKYGGDSPYLRGRYYRATRREAFQ
jgi:phytoene desaturase